MINNSIHPVLVYFPLIQTEDCGTKQLLRPWAQSHDIRSVGKDSMQKRSKFTT